MKNITTKEWETYFENLYDKQKKEPLRKRNTQNKIGKLWEKESQENIKKQKDVK